MSLAPHILASSNEQPATHICFRVFAWKDRVSYWQAGWDGWSPSEKTKAGKETV